MYKYVLLTENRKKENVNKLHYTNTYTHSNNCTPSTIHIWRLQMTNKCMWRNKKIALFVIIFVLAAAVATKSLNRLKRKADIFTYTYVHF